LHTSLEHRLQSKVKAKRPERAAHAHTFCAPDGLDHAVDGEEAGAIDGVEEVHKRGQVRAALSHGVELFLPPKGRLFNKQASPILPTKLSSTHLLSLS